MEPKAHVESVAPGADPVAALVAAVKVLRFNPPLRSWRTRLRRG